MKSSDSIDQVSKQQLYYYCNLYRKKTSDELNLMLTETNIDANLIAAINFLLERREYSKKVKESSFLYKSYKSFLRNVVSICSFLYKSYKSFLRNVISISRKLVLLLAIVVVVISLITIIKKISVVDHEKIDKWYAKDKTKLKEYVVNHQDQINKKNFQIYTYALTKLVALNDPNGYNISNKLIKVYPDSVFKNQVIELYIKNNYSKFEKSDLANYYFSEDFINKSYLSTVRKANKTFLLENCIDLDSLIIDKINREFRANISSIPSSHINKIVQSDISPMPKTINVLKSLNLLDILNANLKDKEADYNDRKSSIKDFESAIDTMNTAIRDYHENVINLYGYIVGQTDTRTYEIIIGNPMYSSSRGVLYTLKTSFQSKGVFTIKALKLGDTEVKLKEEFGGFDQSWPQYIEYNGYSLDFLEAQKRALVIANQRWYVINDRIRGEIDILNNRKQNILMNISTVLDSK